MCVSDSYSSVGSQCAALTLGCARCTPRRPTGAPRSSPRAAARLCESLGHHVEEASIELDAQRIGEANFSVISTALAHEIDLRAAQAAIEVGPDVLEPITLGFYHYGKQVPGTAVAAANVVHQEESVKVGRFMANYDVVLSPVLASSPAPLGIHGLNNTDFAAWGAAVAAYTPFPGVFNMTGMPSMSVPLAMSSDGLPIGIMFSSHHGNEDGLLQLAGQLERAAPWFDHVPPLA